MKVIKDKKYELVHVPREDNLKDQILGKYLNNMPMSKRLPMSFIFLADGCYKLGLRKISIKIEKDNEIYINNGSSVMHIKDFIQ